VEESRGAVVAFDPATQNFTVVNTWPWKTIDNAGCDIELDPDVAIDRKKNLVVLDFIDDFSLMVEVDAVKGDVSTTTKNKSPFWVGYLNFDVLSSSSSPDQLIGLSPTVTQNGLCSDGCMDIGTFKDGKFTLLQNVLYKAVMDDTHYFDRTNNLYYAQFSYALGSHGCSANNSDQCLVAISTTTGDIVSSLATPNFTAYNFFYASSPDSVLVWAEDYAYCDVAFDSYLFGTLDMATAALTPVACIPKNVVVHEDEWISDFSLDGSQFATASGDTETGSMQLLVFNVTSGLPLVRSDLGGLKKALGAWEGFIVVWSLNYIASPAIE